MSDTSHDLRLICEALSRGDQVATYPKLEVLNRAANELEALQLKLRKLQIELAGKEAVIESLSNDVRYYRKEWKDQMIQDQGLPEKPSQYDDDKRKEDK